MAGLGATELLIVRSGKPCFVGTRMAVYDVLDYLASGMTTEEIVADFPELTPQHVIATVLHEPHASDRGLRGR